MERILGLGGERIPGTVGERGTGDEESNSISIRDCMQGVDRVLGGKMMLGKHQVLASKRQRLPSSNSWFDRTAYEREGSTINPRSSSPSIKLGKVCLFVMICRQ